MTVKQVRQKACATITNTAEGRVYISAGDGGWERENSAVWTGSHSWVGAIVVKGAVNEFKSVESTFMGVLLHNWE